MVKEVAIVVATNVHDVCLSATRSAWLHPSFGGEDGVPHFRSLLKPAALSDRRHQPFIIGSAVAPAMWRHAAAGKTRRRRRPVRRRPRPEDLMGRPQSAGLARWSGGWARRAAWEVAGGASRARPRGLVNSLLDPWGGPLRQTPTLRHARKFTHTHTNKQQPRHTRAQALRRLTARS